MLKRLTIILLFFASVTTNAQVATPTAQELLDNSKAFFEANRTFQADLVYTLLRNPDAPIVIEQYNGTLIKDGKNMYSKIQQTEFLLVKDEFIKVNHIQKAMEYVKGNTSNMAHSPLEVDQYLTYFSEKKVIDEGTYWKCLLSTPMLTQLPYGSAILYFSKDTFMLKRQVLELVAPGSIKDEKNALTPELKYLKIEIEKFSNTPKSIGEYFRVKNYVLRHNNKVSVSSKLSDYKLIDRSIK